MKLPNRTSESNNTKPIDFEGRTYASKSALVRELWTKKEMAVSDISKVTGIRYQQVRNIIERMEYQKLAAVAEQKEAPRPEPIVQEPIPAPETTSKKKA